MFGQELPDTRVHTIQDALDFSIDRLSFCLAIVLTRGAWMDVEESRPAFRFKRSQAERFTHSILGDHAHGDVGCLLQVVLGTG